MITENRAKHPVVYINLKKKKRAQKEIICGKVKWKVSYPMGVLDFPTVIVMTVYSPFLA